MANWWDNTTYADLEAGTSLGYNTSSNPKVQGIGWWGSDMQKQQTLGGYVPTSQEGVFYDVNTGEWRQAGTPKAPAEVAPAPKPTAPSGGGGGGGVSTAPKAPAPIYKAPEVKPPEPFRANVKTGQEAGSDFKMFKGGEFADKTGMTADSLRIGGVAPKGTGRTIKKRKQLDTLGLNATPGIGLGI